MAVLALGAIGAGIGAMTIGSASVGWVAGVMLGNALFAPDVEGPRLGDLRVTGTEYGQPIPWVAGSPRIAGQIVWASNKRETANTQSAKGGPEQTTYTYDCDLLILLTENEIAGVSRIWSNGELVWGNGQTKSGVWADLRVYTGAADQMPDPTYEAAVGASNAPAYRGRGYVVIQGLQLGGGGQIPNLTFEVNAGSVFCIDVDLGSPDDYTLVSGSVDYFSTTDGAYGNAFVCLENSSYVPVCVLEKSLSVNLQITNVSLKFMLPNNLGTNSDDSGILRLLAGDGSVIFDFRPVREKIYDPSRRAYVTIHGTEQAVSSAMLSSGVWYEIAVSVDGELLTADYALENLSLSALISSGSIPLASASEIVEKIQFLVSPVLFGEPIAPETHFSDLRICGFVDGVRSTLNSVSKVLLDRSQFESSDFYIDTSLTNTVRALAISNVSGTRATLDILKSAYFFGASKSDKIYIRPRAVDPVATISYADLGASEDAVSDAEALALTMANDLEIPGQIALSYPNMSGDYQTATEHSDRLLSGQESVQAVQMPLGMLPAEAKALADALLFDQVAGMTKTTVRLPLRYAYIEPGDVIEAVNFDGRSYRLRVQVKRDTLSIIELDCVLDDVGALDSAAVTDTGYITTTEPVRVAPTVFEALDIPLLRDADNSPGYYVALGAQRESAADEWKGALVARSWDDTSYAELFRATDEGVLATCSTTLGDWTGGNTWDESNTLTVVTSGGELASSTRSAMQADEALNVLAVGSQATGWELLRFRRAELTAPNTYVLSGFLRGFRGTEWRMGSHAAGEQAVLLDAALRRATSQTSQIGLARYIKAVTFGQILANVDGEAFTDTGEALRPWAPAHPVALADDDGDLVLTWQRRTRLSYRYDGDSPAVPLGEAAELYRVRVYDGATLVRTATATEPTYLYTAAEQAADGFAPGDPVTFEICQVSETVGAGRPAICTGVAP